MQRARGNQRLGGRREGQCQLRRRARESAGAVDGRGRATGGAHGTGAYWMARRSATMAELAREDPEMADVVGRGEKGFEEALAAAGQRTK